jgi:hypothetical protein
MFSSTKVIFRCIFLLFDAVVRRLFGFHGFLGITGIDVKNPNIILGKHVCLTKLYWD